MLQELGLQIHMRTDSRMQLYSRIFLFLCFPEMQVRSGLLPVHLYHEGVPLTHFSCRRVFSSVPHLRQTLCFDIHLNASWEAQKSEFKFAQLGKVCLGQKGLASMFLLLTYTLPVDSYIVRYLMFLIFLKQFTLHIQLFLIGILVLIIESHILLEMKVSIFLKRKCSPSHHQTCSAPSLSFESIIPVLKNI